MNIETLMANFPFPEVRPPQEKAMIKLASNIEKDKKFSIFEMPTGSGKSGLAMAAIQSASSGAILTPQKILQQQYQEEFSHLGLADLRGSANYKCTEHEDTTCDLGAQLNKITGTICAVCPYRSAKYNFCRSKIGTTNFSYFLTDSAFKEESVRLPDREVLVIDEAHNTENVLIAHSEIVISPIRLEELGVKLPTRPFQFSAVNPAREWISKVVNPATGALIAQLNLELKDPSKGRRELLPIARKVTQLNQFSEGMKKFVESESEMWFIDQSEGGLNIKPLRGDVFADELLFSRAKRIIMLSATILDPKTLIRNLGIDRKECGYLSLPSEFPVENRPIIFAPAGSMSFKNYDETLPKLLKRIDRVLTKHATEKGIIHCSSFKLVQHIKEYFKDSPHYNRLLDHDSKNRGMVVDYHISSSAPTVLLSPSMTEGLDLKGELSRFQVIAKAPFLSLASPYTRTRMEMDADWYTLQACLNLMQACGRSIRSKEDYATTYLLDSDIMRLLKAGPLPSWWLDSIDFR
jgi:Rad3-related DNA helicase